MTTVSSPFRKAPLLDVAKFNSPDTMPFANTEQLRVSIDQDSDTPMKLVQFADWYAGWNSDICHIGEGGIAMLIQGQNLHASGLVGQLTRIHLPARYSDAALLKPGNLVLKPCARGYIATVIIKPPALFTLCVAPLLIVEIDRGSPVLPEYLAWAINQLRESDQLLVSTPSSPSRIMTPEELIQMTITLPQLPQQKHIVEAWMRG